MVCRSKDLVPVNILLEYFSRSYVSWKKIQVSEIVFQKFLFSKSFGQLYKSETKNVA